MTRRPDDVAAVPAALPPDDRPPSGGAAVLQAGSLFRGSREVVIAHAGQRYRLRITQNDKLILTK